MNLSTTLALQANYKLDGRTVFQGLQISIENKKGSVRKGKCEPGKPWSCWKQKMVHHYGYLTDGVEGVDGDKLDVFIGPNPNAQVAYVVHTQKAPAFKTFDEDKCMLGFNSAAEAKKAFIANYGGEARHFGSIDTIPMKEFKRRVQHPDAKPQKLVAAWELVAGQVQDTLDQEETGGGGPAHMAATRRKKKLQAFGGEPSAGGTGYAHYESTPTFHPPSLRKAKRVPTDDPMETDDTFLDVTKRKSKSVDRMRKRLMKQHTSLGGIPPNTAQQHTTGSTGFMNPIVSGA